MNGHAELTFGDFRGTIHDAAEFTNRVWLGAYRGRASFPLWDADFFDWALGPDLVERKWLSAAYDGDRLVGTLFSAPVPALVRGESVTVTMASWLSVDPEYAGRGVARGLAARAERVMLESDCAFMLGFVMPGAADGGRRFWSRIGTATFARPIYLWSLPIDAATLAGAEAHLVWRLGALLTVVGRSGRPWHARRSPRGCTVRVYAETDLDACLALLQRAAARTDLALAWTRPQLARQLAHKDFVRTQVIERDGSVIGVVNGFPLTLFGRAPMHALFLDHVVLEPLGLVGTADALRAALASMVEGIDVVVTSRMSGASAGALARAGFVPMWPGYRPTFVTPGPGVPPQVERMLVTFR